MSLINLVYINNAFFLGPKLVKIKLLIMLSGVLLCDFYCI